MKKVITVLTSLLVLATMLTVLSGCDTIQDAADSLMDNVNSGDQTSDTGHTNISDQEGTGTPIPDHFNGVTPNTYRLINDIEYICESGTCPEKSNLFNHMTDENWLDLQNYSEIIDDTLLLHISSMNSADMMGSCTEKDTFSYPYKLTITSMTDDTIVAEGTGVGYHEVVGDGCSEGNYKYRYETAETWTFTTKDLTEGVVVEAYTSDGSETILAPGWENPQSFPPYSEQSIIVKVTETNGFNVRPAIKVVKINGYATESQVLRAEYEKISDTEIRVTFGAFYDAEYTVQAYAWVYGKNGATLNEVYAMDNANATEDSAIKDFVVIVTGSDNGPIPDSMYK